MGVWESKPNVYKEHDFIEIPEGEHRVKICNVSVEKFKNEKKCYEITFKVSGHHGKLWYYLWYNPEYMESSSKRFFSFFNSFHIENHDLSQYKSWIGKSGAVKVVHNQLSDGYEAVVSYCLNDVKKDKLPPWSEAADKLFPTDDITDGQIF